MGIGSLIRPELLGYLPYIVGIYFAVFLKKRVKFSILCKNLSALLLASMIFILLSWIPYITVLFILVETRYFVPLVPIAIILCSRGIDLLQHRFSNWLAKQQFARLPALTSHLVLIIVSLSLLPYTFRPLYRSDENAIYRQAGEWMRENFQPPLRILGVHPAISYYAKAHINWKSIYI